MNKIKFLLLDEEEKIAFLRKDILKLRGLNLKDGYTPVKGIDYNDGIDGRNGVDGIDGENGVDGMDGKNGKDGRDGRDGKDGRDGLDGKDGIDGETPEIKDIIKELLKELKKKQYLEPKDIKGMPINMNDMRWHGGGISKVVHDATMTGDGTETNPLSAVASGSTGAIISATDSGNQQDYNLAKAPTTSQYYVIMNNGSYTTDDLVYGFSVVGTVLIFNNVLTPDISGSIIKLICI